MRYEKRKTLSNARLEHAEESFSAAENLLRSGNYKSAANRSYYVVFHAMRAVLVYDEIDRIRERSSLSVKADMKRNSVLLCLLARSRIFCDSNLNGFL